MELKAWKQYLPPCWIARFGQDYGPALALLGLPERVSDVRGWCSARAGPQKNCARCSGTDPGVIMRLPEPGAAVKRSMMPAAGECAPRLRDDRASIPTALPGSTHGRGSRPVGYACDGGPVLGIQSQDSGMRRVGDRIPGPWAVHRAERVRLNRTNSMEGRSPVTTET